MTDQEDIDRLQRWTIKKFRPGLHDKNDIIWWLDRFVPGWRGMSKESKSVVVKDYKYLSAPPSPPKAKPPIPAPKGAKPPKAEPKPKAKPMPSHYKEGVKGYFKWFRR